MSPAEKRIKPTNELKLRVLNAKTLLPKWFLNRYSTEIMEKLPDLQGRKLFIQGVWNLRQTDEQITNLLETLADKYQKD